MDVVLSEDVDTLMFGSRVTLRNWSPEQKSSKVPTHVNVYDADKTKAGPSGLDREGMILVALMSGGDYLPEGIPGCGPKTACEAARAGFGQRLCSIKKKDTVALQEWREDLARELRTNESKFFKRKHGALSIPEDFPRVDILSYYTNPAISSRDGLERLKRNLHWDQDLNFPELRTFTADAFEWVKISGAKKFIRNLAPALLVRNLRMRGQAAAEGALCEDPDAVEAEEAKLVAGIHGKRQHPSTDNTPELRIAFSPIGIVNIDLDAEEPDDESDEGEEEDEEEMAHVGEGDGDGEALKKRGLYLYDPTQLEKIWIFETIVKAGAPLSVQGWEEKQRKKTAPKPAKVAKVTKPRATKKAASSSQRGALDRFTRITKAGVGPPPAKRLSPTIDRLDLSQTTEITQPKPGDLPISSNERATRKDSITPVSHPRIVKEPAIIEILSSPDVQHPKPQKQAKELDEHYLSPNVTKRLRPLRRAQTSPVAFPEVLPSQDELMSDACRTSAVAGDLFSSTALQPISETASSQEPFTQLQKPVQTRSGLSRSSGPSTPSRRRQQRKASEDVSPTQRQMTLEESFGFSKSNSPSKSRHEAFLGRRSTDKSAVEEVEELDLSHSSPPASQWQDSRPQQQPRAKTSSQTRQRGQIASSHQTLAGESWPSDRAMQGISGNRSKPRKTTETALDSDKEPSAAAPRLKRLGAPSEVRRSPRQHGGVRVVAAEGATLELRRSPRQHRTAAVQKEQAADRIFNTQILTGQDSGEDGILGNKAKPKQKKQVIKLRESLQGSWKLVDASSVEVLDMTGDVDSQNLGGGETTDGRKRSRRAWRYSEVEVLDLTNG